jgi:hypothetical protein
MYFVYQDHLYGTAYISTSELEYEERYCEQCGDSDWLLNTFDSQEEAEAYVEEYNNE